MISVEQPVFGNVLDSLGSPTVIREPLREDIIEKYISTVIDLYKKLSGLPKLDPAPEVNAIFGGLVSVCAETPNETIAERVLLSPFHYFPVY